MASDRAKIAARRFLAFGVDWLLIACWGGLLFVAVALFFGGQIPRPSNPWQLQLVALATMTVPVVLYFALAEASRARATLGKRVLGLSVVTAAGNRVAIGKSFLRSCIKFTPWALGHVVAVQTAFATSDLPFWVYLPMAFAYALPAWWVAAILFRGRAPYDLAAVTYVVRRVSAQQFAAADRHRATRAAGG